MKNQIQKPQQQGVAKLRTYPVQRKVTLTESELRNLEADRWGWRTLRICGAALCVCVGLWVISSMFEQKPAIMPKCQSDCNVRQGWF